MPEQFKAFKDRKELLDHLERLDQQGRLAPKETKAQQARRGQWDRWVQQALREAIRLRQEM